VLVGGNRSAHALFYHWNGTIWTRSRGIHGIPYAMSGTSAIDDWAVGSAPRGNSTAHWDGSAWHRVANPDEGTVTMLQAATSVAADDVWAGGYSDEPLGTKLSPLLEHWDGTTWVRVDAPKPLHGHNNIVTGLASTSGSDVWAVGLSYHSGFHVRHSFIMHWDGSHWTL
jgi:hypothetical protein